MAKKNLISQYKVSIRYPQPSNATVHGLSRGVATEKGLSVYIPQKSDQVNFVWSNNDVRTVIQLTCPYIMPLKFYTSQNLFLAKLLDLSCQWRSGGRAWANCPLSLNFSLSEDFFCRKTILPKVQNLGWKFPLLSIKWDLGNLEHPYLLCLKFPAAGPFQLF